MRAAFGPHGQILAAVLPEIELMESGRSHLRRSYHPLRRNIASTLFSEPR